MKRLLLVLLAFSCFNSISYGQRVRIPCPSPLNSITDCPDTGCGNVDPHLNRQKNIGLLDSEAEPMTIQQIRKLRDPVPGFSVGNTRERIEALGEGKKIVVVANAIAVRRGRRASCNCGLSTVADTDNHIVLVDRVLRKRSGESARNLLRRRELNSITAEFSPRVRLDQTNLTRANLSPLIAFNRVQKVHAVKEVSYGRQRRFWYGSTRGTNTGGIEDYGNQNKAAACIPLRSISGRDIQLVSP